MATAKMSLKKKRPCTSPTLPPGAQTVQVHESGREERNKMNSSSNCLSRYDGRVRSYSGGFDDVGAALGLDIGGSLSKMVLFEPIKTSNLGLKKVTDFVTKRDKFGQTGKRFEDLSFFSTILGGRFHFLTFETSHMDGAISMIKEHGLNSNMFQIRATGGGSHKFQTTFQDSLGIKICPLDELGTMIKALHFLVLQNSDEVYNLECLDCTESSRVRCISIDLKGNLYPYMLCNIGSGVSIVQVNGEHSYQRVSGTALGGGTFFGLARLLTDLNTFEDCMDAAASGKEDTVNMLVRDIYGSGIAKFNLPGDFTASFFGKAGRTDNSASTSPNRDDICRALIVMITQNISQISYLNSVIYGSKRVVFTGNFLRMNPIALQTLSYAMQRWSETGPKSIEASYLRHEGHLGAIGSYLENLDLEYFSGKQQRRGT